MITWPARKGRDSMISIEKLSKTFGDVAVLNDVSIDIDKGEVVAVIGPSGTGKSTFLRCLNLLEQPSCGSVRIDGVDLLDRKTDVPKIRQRMNMVFQSFNLFAHLTVLENLTVGPIKLRGMEQRQAETKAMDLLRQVGLAEKADRFPDELSGGQKQRVAIARCLAMEPEIILFDEPTSALDPTMVSEVLAVIRRLAKDGMTMVIVTHEMDFARDVASRVLYMDEGGIYEQGTAAQIFGDPQRSKTREFVNRIRSQSWRIASPDYDLYAIIAEMEAFCEKQILPRRVRQNLELLLEELLLVYRPLFASARLDMTIFYSERLGSVEIVCEDTAEEGNPFERQAPDEFGRNIIRNLTETIDYKRKGDRNTLHMVLKKI